MTAVKLSPNHQIVYEALKQSHKPVTAYELIAKTGSKGITAPPTIYRALEKLISSGLAHRLESLNAFIACSCKHHLGRTAVFLLCGQCGDITELEDKPLERRLDKLAAQEGFSSEHTTIEMRGLCQACVA